MKTLFIGKKRTSKFLAIQKLGGHRLYFWIEAGCPGNNIYANQEFKKNEILNFNDHNKLLL